MKKIFVSLIGLLLLVGITACAAPKGQAQYKSIVADYTKQLDTAGKNGATDLNTQANANVQGTAGLDSIYKSEIAKMQTISDAATKKLDAVKGVDESVYTKQLANMVENAEKPIKSAYSANQADLTDSEFENELNAGKKLNGKKVEFTVTDIQPQMLLGFDLDAGQHLNFVSYSNPGYKVGDKLIVRVDYVESFMGSWIIKYTKIPIVSITTSTSK
ncbi:MAG: hypothetical protein LBI43_05210 [Streptococcaceae bacterium]|jgi:hypothetical protein|nr:hypothetical protein [Streptococcaceae bacterium]